MNLYLLTQSEHTGWDTYDSCVVAAETPKAAAKIHPEGCIDYVDYDYDDLMNIDEKARATWRDLSYSWVDRPSKVTVTLIGTAAPDVKRGVICASFNAG